jgi:hypothetical protein
MFKEKEKKKKSRKKKKEKYICEGWKKKMALDKVGTFLNNKISSNQWNLE